MSHYVARGYQCSKCHIKTCICGCCGCGHQSTSIGLVCPSGERLYAERWSGKGAMRQSDNRPWVRTTIRRCDYSSSNSSNSSDEEELESLREQLAKQTIELQKLKAFKDAADAAAEAKSVAEAKSAADV